MYIWVVTFQSENRQLKSKAAKESMPPAKKIPTMPCPVRFPIVRTTGASSSLNLSRFAVLTKPMLQPANCYFKASS